ncbi:MULTISPECIES: flagellar protein G [Haloarcula]|uniref:Flagellar protein G n=1 Tax=Haloarcula pellucida TaxID=1427151 RepID=A0A830GPN1_9EURY|nr:MULTISPECIES: flagellar protein G [Halomicroarcula]MBX0349122.1 flagellar protein G [Halomicroarcula pellucida]MDS0279285.1 flagellar protein G [Halomicroarcula sp. S1AR25-4]QIO21638.1 flagellar protein G [Haloarcula sp. JP-L23]GGN99126.1 flagellar protein G [Halomicroarcula pellucida]
MASVSVSHLIIFIASMMIAASVAGVFTDSIGQLSNAVSEQGLDVSRDVRTDVEVISDSGSSAVYNSDGNENVTLHVKNTGSEPLGADPGQMDLFLDGQFVSNFGVTLLDGTDGVWRPGTVVRVEIATSGLSAGDHRVKIIVNGDEEVFRFRA